MENLNYKLVTVPVDGFDYEADNLLMAKQREDMCRYLADLGIHDFEGNDGWGSLTEAWWWKTLNVDQQLHVAKLGGYEEVDSD